MITSCFNLFFSKKRKKNHVQFFQGELRSIDISYLAPSCSELFYAGNQFSVRQKMIRDFAEDIEKSADYNLVPVIYQN